LADESIIFVRASDRRVHALLNVCSHRGSRICLEETGHAAKLVCPYHGWCFDHDGTFVTARHMPERASNASLDLRRAHVLVAEDLIFVCLGAEPPDFGPVAADIQKFYAPHGFTRAKICARTSLVLRSNWKIAAENFFECYHCLPSHPE